MNLDGVIVSILVDLTLVLLLSVEEVQDTKDDIIIKISMVVNSFILYVSYDLNY